MASNLKLQNVRGSHLHVFQLRAAVGGGDPKASAALLIRKDQTENLSAIHAAITTESLKLSAGNPHLKVHVPLYDGDGLRDNGQPFAPECKGYWVLNTASKQLPVTMDQAKQVITDPTRVVSGDYLNVVLSAYGYKAPGRAGVTFDLKGIQLVRKGEPLGVVSVIDAFDVVSEEADAAA
jgi:hypothetical protein